MTQLFETPTLLKILLAQGDRRGAQVLFERLTQKGVELDAEISREFSHLNLSASEAWERQLQFWLGALKRK